MTASSSPSTVALPLPTVEPEPPLDAEMAVVMEAMRRSAAGKPAYSSVTPVEFRKRLADDRAVNPNPAAVARVENIDVPVGNGQSVKVRLYSTHAGSTPQPVFVYLHGGGWIAGSIETHDHVARQLAIASGVLIASVDYPLAPEHPFPEAPRQIVEVVRWFAHHGAVVGADGARIAIGGDSAGGNLSMAALLWLRNAGEPLLRFGVLMYGCFSIEALPSHRTLGDGRFGLAKPSLDYYWRHYLGDDETRRHNPIAVPLQADLHGLPPLFVLTGGLDPVRDDARHLAARLALAGQPFRYREYAGLVHGFMHYYREVKAVAQAIATIGSELQHHLRQQP